MYTQQLESKELKLKVVELSRKNEEIQKIAIQAKEEAKRQAKLSCTTCNEKIVLNVCLGVELLD